MYWLTTSRSTQNRVLIKNNQSLFVDIGPSGSRGTRIIENNGLIQVVFSLQASDTRKCLSISDVPLSVIV